MRQTILMIVLLLGNSVSIAAEQIFVRQYTYHASEADSKITARIIALEEVKRALLGELGTHVSALVKQQSSPDGRQFDDVEIETLSAGVISVQILDEKWNGVTYVLKAQIKADPSDVLVRLNKMLDADKKQKQISQLSTDLSKLSTQNIQVAQSLTRSKTETNAALLEIASLREQLKEKQTGDLREKIEAKYKKQFDTLNANELFDSAMTNYNSRNYTEALELLRKSAEHGSNQAKYSLGVMYDNGQGVLQNYTEALKWYRLAADEGLADAQSSLGAIYENGLGVPQNPAEAVKWYQLAANQGLAGAQSSLGWLYESGQGVTQSDTEAAKWYRLAADQGLPGAQSSLGLMYSNGKGVPQSATEAVKWYRLAADQGLANAQSNLGWMYENGQGVSQSYIEAAKWYRLAADQGLACAQSNLGLLYENGQGVAQSYTEAAKWYRLAADQGSDHAQSNLGVLYNKGQGVPRSYTEAVKWYRLAAAQGNAIAQFNLGAKYAKGQGVTKNNVKAHLWFNLSANSGITNAIVVRDLIAKEMTPKQIKEAQQMAEDCIDNNLKGCD